MRKSTFIIFLTSLFLFNGGLSAHAMAPDFEVTDTQGMIHTLKNYRGQYLVMEWFNPDCPFVKKHYGSGNMQSLQQEFTQHGVQWLSINSSAPGKQGNYSPEEHEAMMSDQGGGPNAIVLDESGELGKLYGAKTTPHIFIINPEGNLIYQGAIDSIASANPADIQQATNYVRETLMQALSDEEVLVSKTKPYGCSVKY